MPDTLERRLQVPRNMPPRVVEDIETYSALVEMQAKMGASAPWFQKLA